MTKYQENFIYTTSFIKKLLKIKMVTLLLGHPVLKVKHQVMVKLKVILVVTLQDQQGLESYQVVSRILS